MSDQHYLRVENAGKRLLSTIIDETATSSPLKCFMTIPNTSDLNEGLKDITYGQIAPAIDRCAWWIDKHLGKGTDHPTIAAYLDPMDFRHVILIFGAIKSGYQVRNVSLVL